MDVPLFPPYADILNTKSLSSYVFTSVGCLVVCVWCARRQKEGRHEIRVRAVDSAGNADPSPATYSWIVDRAGVYGHPSMVTNVDAEGGNKQVYEAHHRRQRLARRLARGGGETGCFFVDAVAWPLLGVWGI